MAKRDVTSAQMSQDLKTGMIAAGNYPGVSDMDTFYGAGNAIWCVIGVNSGGFFRCLTKANEFTDLFAPSDPEITRAWSVEELTGWFVSNYQYDDYTETQQGNNTTISFSVHGLSFSGTDNSKVVALAKAVLLLLSSQAAKKPKTVDLSALPKTSKKSTKK